MLEEFHDQPQVADRHGRRESQHELHRVKFTVTALVRDSLHDVFMKIKP